MKSVLLALLRKLGLDRSETREQYAARMYAHTHRLS